MAKKKNPLACPAFTTKLLEIAGHCDGVYLTCPHCGASILVDVDADGRMRLSLEPVKDQVPKNSAPQN